MTVSSKVATRCAPIAWRGLAATSVALLEQLAAAIDVELVEWDGLRKRIPALLVCPDATDAAAHIQWHTVSRKSEHDAPVPGGLVPSDLIPAEPSVPMRGDATSDDLSCHDQAWAGVPLLTIGPHGAFQLPADAQAVAMAMHQACQRSWLQVLNGGFALVVVAGWAGGVGTSSLAHAIAKQAGAVLVDASGPGIGVGQQPQKPEKTLTKLLVGRRADVGAAVLLRHRNIQSDRRGQQPGGLLRILQKQSVQAPSRTLAWADLDPNDIVPGDVLFHMLPTVRRVPTLCGDARGGVWPDDPRVITACRELRCVSAVVVDAGRWNRAASRLATQARTLVLVGPGGNRLIGQESAIRLAASIRQTRLPGVSLTVVGTGAAGTTLLKHAAKLVWAEQAQTLVAHDAADVAPLRARFFSAGRPAANGRVAKRMVKHVGLTSRPALPEKLNRTGPDARQRAAPDFGGEWHSVKGQLCAT